MIPSPIHLYITESLAKTYPLSDVKIDVKNIKWNLNPTSNLPVVEVGDYYS
jgi:hypothetical protein